MPGLGHCRRPQPLLPSRSASTQTSLADPMLVPEKSLQVVVPRPGVPADVQIGLVGGGDIEGAVVKGGGLGFEGLDLELVDGSGKVVATARSDFDGFFLFERVAYGAIRCASPNRPLWPRRFSTDLGVRPRSARKKPSSGSVRCRQPAAGHRVGRDTLALRNNPTSPLPALAKQSQGAAGP